MAEELDQPPLKDVYRKLITDGETSPVFRKYSFTSFRDRMLSNPDASGEVADFLIQRGIIKDREEWKHDWLEPSVPKAPKPVAQQAPSRPVQVPPLLQPAQPSQGPSLTQVTGQQAMMPMAPEPQFQPFQFQNEKEIQQAAKSPVFLANKPAMQVMADREQMAEANPLTWRQDEKTGKYGVFEKDAPFESKPLATFDTMNQAAAAIKTRGAASDALIMPTKEAEQEFQKMSPDQQQATIEGLTGAQFEQNKKNEERTFAQKYGIGGDFDKTMGELGLQIGAATLEGIKDYLKSGEGYRMIQIQNEMSKPENKGRDPISVAQDVEVKLNQELYDAQKQISERFDREIKKNNISTDAFKNITEGNWERVPESVLYTVGSVIMQVAPSIATYGTSTYFQTLPQVYKAGVDARAKELGITPEEVIRSGQDGKTMAKVVGLTQAALERVGAGMVSSSIAKQGGYTAVRDWVIGKLGKSTWSKAAGRGAGLGFASVGEGFTGGLQEVTSVLQEGKMANKGILESFEGQGGRILSAAGNEAIGGFGAAGLGRTFAGRGNADSNIPPPPPTSLGGIPTQPVSDGDVITPEVIDGNGGPRFEYANSLEEIPEQYRASAKKRTVRTGMLGKMGIGPTKEIYTYEIPIETVDITSPQTPVAPVVTPEAPVVEFATVTDDELNAFQTDPNFAENNPERVAGVQEDADAVRNGEMTLEAIEDPNYRIMVQMQLDADKPVQTPVTTTGLQTANEVVKPEPIKLQVMGREVNMYNDYIPAKAEDVEPDAVYSFNADSKDGIPPLLRNKAYANPREVNGVKSENWHASISGDDLLKLYTNPQANDNTNAGTSQSNVDEGVGQRTGSENVVTDAGVVPAPTGSGTGAVLTEQSAAVPLPQVEQTQQAEVAPLNIDFQKNEGRNVNYQGITGRVKIDSDGAPYVFTKDGEVVYIEGGLSGQTPQQLGLQPLADDVVNEADIENVLQDENAPLDQGQLEYDFENNTLTLYGRPFSYDGIETNNKGQTTALRLIDQNGKIKFIRNQDVILEFEIQKEIYEKQPTAKTINAAATELQVKPIERSESSPATVQQTGPVADTEVATEEVVEPTAKPASLAGTTFKTAKGSVYTYLPDGRTQRFKTATKEQSEPQDLMVFVKFKDSEQEQDFLEGIQRSERFGTKVYLIDQQGNKYDTNEQAAGKDVRLALVKDGKVIDTVETSTTPKVGYNTFDQRRFKKDGENYRESHLGNKVTEINAPTATPAQQGEAAATAPLAAPAPKAKPNPFIEKTRKAFNAALKKLGLKAKVKFISDEEAAEIVASGEPVKAMTAGFQTRDGKPIGFAYDTDQVARGRFDFSKLKKIGSGSDRDVYDLGDGKVLKVAKTARGLTQNIYEGDFYLKGIIPEVFERGLNYVVAENTPKMKAADVVETFDEDGNVIGKTTAGKMLSDLSAFSQKDFDNRTSKLQDVLTKYGLQDIMSYDVLWPDFTAPRNWGYKDGKAYHSDGGTFGGVDMIDSYKNKTNLSDPEFRKIYEESKRLKKAFGDTDKNTMYMRGPLAPNGKPSNLTPEQHRQVRTPEFKKWFGDWENDPKNASKVVDENGEPLVVYHGSPSKFNSFDISKGGTNTGSENAKEGFYFSNNKYTAESYRRNEIYKNPNIDVVSNILNNLSFDKLKEISQRLRLGIYEEYYDQSELANEILSEIEADDDSFYGDRRKYVEKIVPILKGFGIDFTPYKDVGMNISVFLNLKTSPKIDVDGEYSMDIDLLGKLKKSKTDRLDGLIIENVLDSISFDNKGNDVISGNIYIAFSPNQIKSATENTGEFSTESNDIRYMKDAKGTILGFVQPQPDGSFKVWIDPATTNAETPIHELAGHIFMPLLKEAAPELHAKGVELIQNTSYMDNAKALGLEGAAASEEALAQAIGEKGKQLTESKRKDFLDWLNGMWKKIGEKLGITKPIKDLTLEEFTNLIAGSIVFGKQFEMKGEAGRDARAELKDNVGPEEFKRMEDIHRNGEKMLKELEGKGLIKIDCP